MEYLTREEIVSAVKGKLVLEGKLSKYDNVCTDTRKVKQGDIFIALKGENFNGNDFAFEAIRKGAAICIIDELKFNIEEVSNETSVVIVSNTKNALLDLAAYYRKKLNLKIVAVTGSTGKTSTKDLTYAALSKVFNVYKTQGNFNNEIGLPLTIFNLNSSHEIAVLEMGMSNFNEIHNMAEAARPDIAMITNVGISHIENLGSKDNILKAKMEVCDFFTKDNILILNNEDDMLSLVKNKEFKILKTGIDKGKDIIAENIKLKDQSVEFSVRDNNEYFTFRIDLPGKHTVLNALLAIACAKTLGVNFEKIQQGFNDLQVTGMRMEFVKCGEFTLLNDCYNASPDSMKAAIDVLCNLKGGKKFAVLGTMRELGDEAYKAHKEIGEYAATKGLDGLIVLGEYNKAYEEGVVSYKEGYNKLVFKYFQDYNETADYINSILEKDDCILIKASRAMKFEKIVFRLNELNCK